MRVQLSTCLCVSSIVVPTLALNVSADTVRLSPIADSSIYDDPSVETSNSRGQYLFAGTTLTASTRRALLKFDVAGAIPANAQISNAQLTLIASRQAFNATTAKIFRCLTAWSEGPSQATGEEGAGTPAGAGDPSWNFASFNTVHWSAPGGDCSANSSDSVSVAGLEVVTFSAPAIAGDVSFWLANPAANFGWIIQGDESVSGTATRFGSRENVEPTARPFLDITFTAACAADFNGDLTVDFFDYLDFVDAFSSNAAAADFNHDDVIDFFDYLDFVDAFSAGC